MCSNIQEEKTLAPPQKFDFPFEPYSIQLNFMKQLYSVIENNKLGIFESPTGTGKSLSIICGALKWLIDHNEWERNKLTTQIKSLESEKQKLSSEITDWLCSQSKEIEVTRKLNSLKLENNKINDYDLRIAEIKNRKKVKIDRKKYYKKNDAEVKDLEETAVEEDDILLDEADVVEEDEEEVEEHKYEPIKIYICSRTHSQLSQFVGELIKSPYGKQIRAVTLASRQSYCINSAVTKLKSSSLINERCLDMQKQQSKTTKKDEHGRVMKRQKGTACKCQFYKQAPIDDLRDYTLCEIQDVEDLVEAGKQLNACPYYASRKAAEDSQVILVPYNTILHKATREANGINLKNNVVIIDEAHNLLESIAQMHSSEVTYDQLSIAHHLMKSYKMKYCTRFSASNLLCLNQLLFVTSKIVDYLDKLSKLAELKTKMCTIGEFVLNAQIDNYNMFKLLKFCKDSKIAHKLHSFANKHQEIVVEEPKTVGIKGFLFSIENKQKNCNKEKTDTTNSNIPNKSKLGNPLMAVLAFFESLTYSYEDGRIFINVSSNKNERKLKFLLLNPASQFGDIIKQARSVVVAGGTMKPISEFRDRLFKSAGGIPEQIIEFSCNHIIPPENILPIVITKNLENKPLLFNYENRFSMGDSLKLILQEVCRKVKGGVVVFFPSYKYEMWFWQQVKDVSFGRTVFREPQESGSVDVVLNAYADAIKKHPKTGALLFSIVGGKLSEGLNFNDDLGRCIIVVGMPYANITSPELKEKMSYLDKAEGFGAGQQFYENLCLKSVNQCIGRAVRHRNDYATVLLLDQRYNRISTKNSLPDWIKRSLKTCNSKEAFNLIEMFFQERGSKATIL